MKKIYFLLFSFTTFLGFENIAQTYGGWAVADANGTAYDTIIQYDDTLNFTFPGVPLGAYGTAKIMVYFEGDFGDQGEYLDVYNAGFVNLLGSSTNTIQGDCAPEDSSIVTFSAPNLDLWQTAGNWSIALLPTNQVDFFCQTLRVRVRLEYDYCIAGTPVEFASIVPDTTFVCNHTPTTFTVIPTGGTLTGQGLSGLTFDPAGLAPGKYTFIYTGTDAIGCTTSSSTSVTIGNSPGAQSYLVCEGDNSPILGGSQIEFIYASDVNYTSILDTAVGYVYGPITQSPEIIYTSLFSRKDAFTLDTVTNDNVTFIDHNTVTGDDRGGIAITDSTVYFVGDNNTGRYNLNLTSAGVSLPVRDGLFSDLSALKLWTLYNSATSSMPMAFSGSFVVDAFAEFDANLALTGVVTSLSEPITMGNLGQSGIFAGYGQLGLFDGSTFYVVNISSGAVDSIGQFTFNLQGSESWTDWGVLGFDGVDYIAYYRDWLNEQVVAHNLGTNIITVISQFPGFSDMASFTYHPGTDRFYFHYEGNGHFGGSSETGGFIDGESTLVLSDGGNIVGCPSSIEFTFNSIDFGPDTTICIQDAPYVIEPGLGFSSYTWNGVNNNWNIYPISSTQTVVGAMVDASNCLLTDEITVTVEDCVNGVDDVNKLSYSVYPNPNNGRFTLDFGQSISAASIQIMDTEGRVCYNNVLVGAVQTTQIETANLAKGVYLVVVNSNEKRGQSMIVVQ